MARRNTLAVLSVVLLTVLLTPAGAAAQTFGPNLSQLEPNNQVGCEVDPFFTGDVTGSPSCTWSSNVPLGEDSSNPNGAQIPPAGNGTISQVSIKVGASTGPMQVVVLREELKFEDVGTPEVHANVSCCDAIEQSQVFTPKANAITNEAVNLPVEVEETPNPQTDLLSADILGLSVLADKVPVPATDERSLSVFDQPGTAAWEPAITEGQQLLADEATGYMVLMDAVWNQTGGGTTGGGGSTGGTTTAAPGKSTAPSTPIVGQPLILPTLSFPARNLTRIKGADAVVNLGCGAGAACQGTVRLQSAPAGQVSAVAHDAKKSGEGAEQKKRKAPVVTYASGSFSLAAGVSQAVEAKLSSTGKRFAHKHRRLKVWVNVALTNTTPAKVTSRAVTLTF